MTHPIILDCDPGHDDAIALIMALANPRLTVLAVTTSAGNQTLEKTLNNAIRVLTLLNRTDIAVAGGACKPLTRDLMTAVGVHGESGLDGPDLPLPGFDAEPVRAWELIAGKIRGSQSRVTLVPTGPLTNIAIFLKAYPELKSRIERIVLMGGSAGAGNWTAAAEFNIFVDPEAADIVFKSGVPLVMAGLDVTHRAQIMQEDIARISAIPNKVARAVAAMLNFFAIYHEQPRWGFAGVPLHDPCTIAYLLKPELFITLECNVAIETRSELTLGMTVVDRYHLSGRPENARVLIDLDRKGFVDLLVDSLDSYQD